MPTQEEQILLLENKVNQLTTLVETLLLGRDICPPGIPGPRGLDGIDGKSGKSGRDGEKGKDGLQGAKGYTPLKGVDYFDGKDGKDGSNGQDGQSSFTSYVFKRVVGEEIPARPTGGSYSNPIPSTGNWTDGVTSGQGALYLSSRIFTSDGLPPQQEQWSSPKLAADSTTLDFEWSTIENPGNPTDNPDAWTNEPSENSIWMALRTLDNGVWSEWKIMKIKGENGSKGDTGESGNTSVYMYAKNGSFSNPPALPPTEKNKRYPEGWSETVPPFSELEYLWKIVAVVNSNNDLVGNWSEPFRDTGRVGDKGDKGAFLAPKGEFSDTEQYVGTGERVEAVLYEGDWYVTRSDAGLIPIGTLPTEEQYWNIADESFDFIATGLFLAQVAYIKNLGVENLKTSDEGTRVEIIKEENSLKFYVGSIATPVVTIDTDVAEDQYNPSGTNAGIRISAMGAGGVMSTTTISTSGIFSNSGNTDIYPATAGIQAVTSILGLSFRRNIDAQFDAGIAGMANVSAANNKNLNAIGGFFGTICHGGKLELSQEVANGQTVNLTGSTSFLFSYMANGGSATINLPNFDLNSGGWKGEFGTGLDRVFLLRLLIVNGGVNITVNGQGGREIISSGANSTSYTASTGSSERAIFEFIYTGSHWIAHKKVI